MREDASAKAKRTVLVRGKEHGREFAYAYEKVSGRLVGEARGGRYEINLTLPIVRAIADSDRSIVLHHNHPRSTSFSRADVEVLTANPGLWKLWAHGHNGSSYSALRSEARMDFAVYQRVSDALTAELKSLVGMGTITAQHADLLQAHLTWLVMDRKGLLRYKASLKGASKTAFERNEELLNELVDRYAQAD